MSRSSSCWWSPTRSRPPGRDGQSQDEHLPAAGGHQLRMAGSRTASNRSLQWGEQIVKPIFEVEGRQRDHVPAGQKLGFADKMFKNIKVDNNVPVAEDILREINRGGWSTGYCGQSPERLKLHMANQKDFDLVTLRASDGPVQGRLLRPALAMLGNPRAQASRHPHCSTTPICTSWTAAAHSAPVSAWSASSKKGRRRQEVEQEVSTCWPKAPTRWVRKSRTDIPSSPMAC